MNRVFISIDGNNVGKILERYIFSENLKHLSEFSTKMNRYIIELASAVPSLDGEVVFAGGDNLMAVLPEEHIAKLIKKAAGIDVENIRIAVGVGKSATDSYLALKYAKAVSSTIPILHDRTGFREYIIKSSLT